MRTSKGEQKIIDILKEEGISFVREYSFKDLKTLRGGRPRYDFAIVDRHGDIEYLLEYDGEQHFKRGNILTTTKFQYQLATDRLKNTYCLQNNIPLYRIPYTDLNQIRNSKDFKHFKYRVRTKFHNDNLRFEMKD